MIFQESETIELKAIVVEDIKKDIIPRCLVRAITFSSNMPFSGFTCICPARSDIAFRLGRMILNAYADFHSFRSNDSWIPQKGPKMRLPQHFQPFCKPKLSFCFLC